MNAQQNAADGLFYRPVPQQDDKGHTYYVMRLVCEDCWQLMPPYVIAPKGFVSPESQKYRPASVEGLQGTEALPKVVCHRCYMVAFAHSYPGASLPNLSDEVLEVA